MLPRTFQELKIRTAMRRRPPSFPCNVDRVGGAEPCQASPMFAPDGTPLPFLAQGDLGSSLTAAVPVMPGEARGQTSGSMCLAEEQEGG